MSRTKKRPARTGRFHQHRHQGTPRARRDRNHTTITEFALLTELYSRHVRQRHEDSRR